MRVTLVISERVSLLASVAHLFAVVEQTAEGVHQLAHSSRGEEGPRNALHADSAPPPETQDVLLPEVVGGRHRVLRGRVHATLVDHLVVAETAHTLAVVVVSHFRLGLAESLLKDVPRDAGIAGARREVVG